jgi:hypothetical protein
MIDKLEETTLHHGDYVAQSRTLLSLVNVIRVNSVKAK